MLDTILCVDDDPITLMLCKMVLKKAQFATEVITAKNGQEALDYFENIANKQPPQLIFLDLNMPVLGGWDFLDRFEQLYHEKHRCLQVVVLSSTIDPLDLERAKRNPIVLDFISKPITKEVLENITIKIHNRSV